MGTQRVQMKGVLPWLFPQARRACTRDFYPALATLVSPVQTNFFPHRRMFQFMCPHRPATWAGSHAGPPVSECVSFLLFNSNRFSCTVYRRIEAFFSLQKPQNARRILIRKRIIILRIIILR
jgi:hypothetical protein